MLLMGHTAVTIKIRFENHSVILHPAQKMTESARTPKNWPTLSDGRSLWAHFYRHLSLSTNYLSLC